MLQSLRNKIHGWPAVLVLGVAVFAMSFFGIEGYFTSQSDTYVAKVGKHEISQQQFQDRLNQLRQQGSQELGDRFDASVYEKPEMKQRVLDAMIDQQMLLQANDDLGMKVSDQAMRDTIGAIPAFQVNGQFDPSTYRAVLAGSGRSPAAFEADVQSSLAIQVLPDAIAGSTIVTDADVDRFLDLRLQRRDFRYVTLPRPALTDSHVDDAQVQSYYKAHLADFMKPEQVSLKYIEVNGADLKLDSQPSDEELKKRYNDEKQRFVQPEQRLVSHILVNVPKNATPAQQKQALAKAEKIAAQAKPDDFAKLAAQDSDDLGSKRQGGDLGWLEKGVTDAAFDDALFGMQKGQISKPVLSDEGYHVLWLRDVRSGQAKPFEQVRSQIAQELQSSGREHKFNEVAGKLSDQTYQNPASLEPAAQELGMQIKSTGLFSRKGGEGITGNQKLLAQAFGDDVLVQGNNSGLIELGPNHSVVIHVDKHVPAAARPLAEVAARVRQKILDKRVAEAAKKQADGLLQRLRKGEALDQVAASVKGSVLTAHDAVRAQGDVPAQIRDAAFLMAHPQGKSQFGDVATQGGGYALIALDKVQGADLSKVTSAQRDALRQSMLKAYGTIATSEFIDQLKSGVDIKLAKDRM